MMHTLTTLIAASENSFALAVKNVPSMLRLAANTSLKSPCIPIMQAPDLYKKLDLTDLRISREWAVYHDQSKMKIHVKCLKGRLSHKAPQQEHGKALASNHCVSLRAGAVISRTQKQ